MENKRLRWVLTSYQVLELRTDPCSLPLSAFSTDVLTPASFRRPPAVLLRECELLGGCSVLSRSNYRARRLFSVQWAPAVDTSDLHGELDSSEIYTTGITNVECSKLQIPRFKFHITSLKRQTPSVEDSNFKFHLYRCTLEVPRISL